MNQSHNTSTPKIVGGIVIAAVLLIGVYTLILRKDEDSSSLTSSQTTSQISTAESSTSTAPSTASTTPSDTVGAAATDTAASSSNSTTTSATTTPTYKDGAYTETVSYRVPGDSNGLTAKVTIADGVITAVTTTNQYTDHESARYISGFQSGISSAVKGKSLADAFVGRVGGASLTSSAFNDIIDAIKVDAKA